MAKNSAVNLDITSNADGYDVAGGTTARKLTVTGADITLTGSGANTYTYPASTSTLASLTLEETLTNKTLTSPILTTPTLGVASSTSLSIYGDGNFNGGLSVGDGDGNYNYLGDVGGELILSIPDGAQFEIYNDYEGGSEQLIADFNSTASTIYGDLTIDSGDILADNLSGTNTGDEVEAAGSDLDTGTDQTKYASAKAIKDSHNVPSVAPSTVGNVLTSDGTDWTSADPGMRVYQASVSLTPAELIDLISNPKEIIAAPASGYGIELISAVFSYDADPVNGYDDTGGNFIIRDEDEDNDGLLLTVPSSMCAETDDGFALTIQDGSSVSAGAALLTIVSTVLTIADTDITNTSSSTGVLTVKVAYRLWAI